MDNVIAGMIAFFGCVVAPIVALWFHNRRMKKLSPHVARKMTQILCQAPIQRCKHCGKGIH